MPRIIARRFENIHWGERAIIDNLIDYDLYNNIECLANGGGKTVQIFLTNCLFTHRRYHKSHQAGFSFGLSSYFQEGPAPGIVMVEVLLDQSQKRLLVGMLARKVNGNFDQHNFIYAYKDPEDPMGIRHIPFIQEKEGAEHILSMDRALSLLEDHHFHVYDMTSNNDATKYYKELMSYKISPTQWEEIVMKINEGEGGISKFFKGLDEAAIIRNWLFKVIEEKMAAQNTNEESTRAYLGEAFYRLCEKRRLVDQHLKNEQQALAFIDLLKEQNEAFHSEKAIYDAYIQKQNHLENELGALSSAFEKLHQTLDDLDLKVREKKQEITHIHCEKESLDYHNQVADLKKDKNDLALIKQQLRQITTQLADDTYDYGLLAYAKDYEAYQKQATTAQEYSQLLEDLGSNEDQRRLNDLGYSLKVKTMTLLKDIETSLQKAKDQYGHLQSENQQLEKKQMSLEEQIQKLTVSTTSLDHEIKAYKKQEESVLGQLYPFNILGEHVEGLFKDLQEQANKSIEDLSKQLTTIKEIRDTHQAQLETNKSTQDQATIDHGLTKGHLADAKTIINHDQEIMVNRQARFPDFDPLDITGIIASLDSHIEKQEEAIEEKRKDIEAKQVAYGKLSLTLDQTLSDFLNEHEIHFMSGMDYLRSQTNIEDLIQRNPMLSYAFIIDDQDFEALKSLSMPTVLEPVIFVKRSGIGKSHDITLDEDTFIYLHRDVSLLDEKKVAIQRVAYLQAIDHLKEEIKLFKDDIESTQEAKQTLLQEGLDHRLYESHVSQVRHLEEKQKSLEDLLTSLKQESDALNKQLADEEVAIENLNRQKSDAQLYCNQLLDLEKAYYQYLHTLHQYLDECQLLENAKNEKATLHERILALQEDLQKTSNKQTLLSERRKQIDVSVYASYEKGTLIEASYEQLKNSFETLKEAIGSDEKFYRNMIDQAQKQMENLQKACNTTLSKYQLNEKEAKARAFDESRYKELENAVFLDQKQQRSIENQMHVLDGKLTVKKQNVETLKQRILERYQMIMPLEEIYNAFEQRLDTANATLHNYQEEVDNRNKQIEAIHLATKLLEKQNIKAGQMYSSNEVESLLTMSEKELEAYENDLLEDYQKQDELHETKHKEVAKGLNTLSDDQLDDFAKNMVLQLRRAHEDQTIDQAIEKLQLFIDIMNKKLSINQNTTKEYHHDAEILNERICDYLEEIHHGLNEIDRHTAIEFGDRKRKLIAIETASWEEQKDLIAHKIENLLEQKLQESLTLDSNEALSQFKMKVIEPAYLYNETLGIDSIRIYALKIDQDHQRRFRWDSYRSGAEGTVSSMALLGALLSYLGTDPLTSASQRPWSVLVMDNPFAEMVNNNLVRAFLEAAKSLHVQLILFTGSTQESIIKEADRVIISRLNPSGTISIEEVQKRSTIEAVSLTQQLSLFDL